LKDDEFLYIDPLKQGLKLSTSEELNKLHNVFIHRSIKTRIETLKLKPLTSFPREFLYIDPLKQGLKLNPKSTSSLPISVFIHRSIKTRIETKMMIYLKLTQ